MTTLDQKRKELQRQNENLEKLNKELQRLDVPINKEIATLRAKLENVERELTRATKYRKQKEAELLEAIDAVSKLGDEKCIDRAAHCRYVRLRVGQTEEVEGNGGGDAETGHVIVFSSNSPFHMRYFRCSSFILSTVFSMSSSISLRFIS